MGSYDGAKAYELIGTYILATLADNINKNDTSLYSDNGLIILRNCNRPKTNKIRKQVTKIFEPIGFAIDIKSNVNEIDFFRCNI